MTLSIALMVLASAFLHAGWNALLKWQPDAVVGLNAQLIFITLLTAAAAVVLGAPPLRIWWFILPSLGLHLAYHLLLLSSYKIADLNLAYPILRGAAPLMAALFALLFLGEAPTWQAALGIAAICGGVLLLARGAAPRAVLLALVTAAVIAAYSVVDAAAVRAAPDTLQYVVWLMMLDSVLFLPIALSKRGARALLRAPPKVFIAGFIGAMFSLASYGLALFAYRHAPVGEVAALREVSVIFGALMGYYLLKEKTALRIPGAAMIAAGAALIIGGGVT